MIVVMWFMYLAHDSELWVMGFAHVTCWGTWLIYEFWLAARYGAADLYESAEGFQTMTHYESWVAWREGMSHTGLGLREEPLYKGTPGAWELSQATRPLPPRPYILLKGTPRFAYRTSPSVSPPLSVHWLRSNPSPQAIRPWLLPFPEPTPPASRNPPLHPPRHAPPPLLRSWQKSSRKPGIASNSTPT